jgi:hypothetical protein
LVEQVDQWMVHYPQSGGAWDDPTGDTACGRGAPIADAALTVHEGLRNLLDDLRRLDPAVRVLTPADGKRSQVQQCLNPACPVVLLGKKTQGRCRPCYEYARVNGCEAPAYVVARRVQKKQSRKDRQT